MYEQGEGLGQDPDTTFQELLQHIDVCPIPIKINLHNITHRATDKQLLDFCLSRMQPRDPTQVIELRRERINRTYTGSGYITVKTRKAAKDIVHMWGYPLLNWNVEMDIPYED